jgi:cytochrome c oxidase subunit 2
MLPGMPLFSEQVSTFAPEVNALYFFITAVTAFFALLVVVFVIAFAVRDRTGKGMGKPIHGSIPLEIGWLVVPFLVTMVIFAWATAVLFDMV